MVSTVYMHICVIQIVMSLLAMSLGLRFCASRKGGTGGGGGFQHWAQVTRLLSLLLCTNGLRNGHLAM